MENFKHVGTITTSAGSATEYKVNYSKSQKRSLHFSNEEIIEAIGIPSGIPDVLFTHCFIAGVKATMKKLGYDIDE